MQPARRRQTDRVGSDGSFGYRTEVDPLELLKLHVCTLGPEVGQHGLQQDTGGWDGGWNEESPSSNQTWKACQRAVPSCGRDPLLTAAAAVVEEIRE